MGKSVNIVFWNEQIGTNRSLGNLVFSLRFVEEGVVKTDDTLPEIRRFYEIVRCIRIETAMES